MIRAAAKNHRFVAVVVTPESYDAVLAELEDQGARSPRRPGTGWPTRRSRSPPATTPRSAAGSGMRYEAFPGHWVMAHEKFLDLSYGENPHQNAALYVEVGARSHVLSRVAKLHGRALSFNNVLDLDCGAPRCSTSSSRPACVIVKHNNPCGVAVADDARRGVREGARLRSDVGLRRGDRVQSRGRRDAGRAAARALHRGADRTRLRGGRARGAEAEGGGADPRGGASSEATSRASGT